MKSEKTQKIILGLKLSFKILAPILIIFLIIDNLRLQNIINFSQAQYAFYDYLLLIVIVLGFGFPVIYWMIKRQWLAALASTLGGIALIILMLALGLELSCAQGTCF